MLGSNKIDIFTLTNWFVCLAQIKSLLSFLLPPPASGELGTSGDSCVYAEPLIQIFHTKLSVYAELRKHPIPLAPSSQDRAAFPYPFLHWASLPNSFHLRHLNSELDVSSDFRLSPSYSDTSKHSHDVL